MLTFVCNRQSLRLVVAIGMMVVVASVATAQQAGQARPQQTGKYSTTPITQNTAAQGQAGGQPAGSQAGQLPAGQAGAGQAAAGQPVQLTAEQEANLRAAQQQQSLGGGGVNPTAPFPPLNDQWRAYLDQVLQKWEVESSKIEKFQCEFYREQFDPALVEKHPFTRAKGDLKYMKPDKGLFKVNQLVHYKGADDKGNPQYDVNAKQQFGEYWICDGQYVHILDQNEKKCTKHQLPPQMRGNAIHLSPLPFVFGVKKAELEARYWINPLPRPENEASFIRLDVYPRRADDAANYQRLQVVIDLRDWLPAAIIVFLPNWRPGAEHREVYQFSNRVVNSKSILPAIFQKEFIPADPPKDWKVIIEPYQEEQPAPQQPRVATPPAAMPQLK